MDSEGGGGVRAQGDRYLSLKVVDRAVVWNQRVEGSVGATTGGRA